MQTYRSYTDKELSNLIELGDSRAMSEVYDRYAEALYRQALSVLKDRTEAKDALQEVFTSYWMRHDKIKITSSLRGFLYRAIRNQVLKRYAKKLTHVPLELVDIETHAAGQPILPDDHMQNKELMCRIETEINRLPKKMREVFKLSREEQLTNKEIAENLQLSEDTVKTQLRNARRILRNRLRYFFLLFV